MAKVKYYSLDNILKLNCDYNIIIGERSNGKTTAVLGYGLKRFIESEYTEQLAVIRRWELDFEKNGAKTLFDGVINIGWLEEWTNGEYNRINYYNGRWYLSYYDDDLQKTTRKLDKPFAYAFALTSQEHYKSSSYPDIRTVLFDEFITRSYYLPDEFVTFQNLLSTIIRLRTDVKIFMCGNTVNQFSPYFVEMGLNKIKQQDKGTIDVYQFGEGKLKVAVEYSDFDAKKKESNKYFAFDNPKLKMIKDGSWEIDIYPHLPVKYIEQEVVYRYYINFQDELLECKIIRSNELKTTFTYIHRKTTPIKELGRSLYFGDIISPIWNYRTDITRPYDNISTKIWKYFATNNVYYQDNFIGEIVRNYIMNAQKKSL